METRLRSEYPGIDFAIAVDGQQMMMIREKKDEVRQKELITGKRTLNYMNFCEKKGE